MTKQITAMLLVILLFSFQTAVAGVSSSNNIEEELVLVNFPEHDQRVEGAIALMKVKYPELKVTEMNIPSDQLNVALLAKSDDFDLLQLDTYEYPLYASKGVLVQLDTIDSVSKALVDWIPFQEKLSLNGHFYALPLTINCTYLSIDPRLVRYAPEGWLQDGTDTWIDLASLVALSPIANNDMLTLLEDEQGFPFVLFQYMAHSMYKYHHIDFSTDAFRGAMEAYKTMYKSGIISLSELNSPPSQNAIAQINWIEPMFAPTLFRMWPMMEKNESIPSMVNLIGVNAFSKKKDLAIEFLSEYARPETQNLAFFGDINNMFLADYSNYSTQEYAFDYNEMHERVRQRWMKNWVPMYYSLDFVNYCKSGIVQDYLDGKTPIDKLISQLQTKMNMIDGE